MSRNWYHTNSGIFHLNLCFRSSIFSSISWIVFRNAASLLPVGSSEVWTLNIAAHSDDNIHWRDIRQELAVLSGFHINFVDLLHQPHGVLIDPWFGFCSGRIALKHITCQLLSQGFRNLATAGIVDTDKGYFLHYFPPKNGHRFPMH